MSKTKIFKEKPLPSQEGDKNQKIFLVGIFVLFFLLIASQVRAQGPCEIVHTEGIVPCGLIEEAGKPRCDLCHFFEMLNRIVNYLLFCLIPPLAALMLVIGGFLYLGAALEFLPGGIATLSQAKRLFTSVVIGLLIAYSAWLIINLFLLALGYKEDWWKIECETSTTTLPSAPFNPPIASGATFTTISINQSFSSDDNVFTFQTKPIYSMAVSGRVVLKKPSSYARIILTDFQGKQYLIYEVQGPFDSGSFSFENHCEESCVLNGIIPKSVKTELEGATIKIAHLQIIEEKTALKPEVQAMGLVEYQAKLDREQEGTKIEKMNQYLKAKNLRWRAGETGISSYTYNQKKNLLGVKKLPNLFGFDYYKGGIFD